jgi:regulator of protease activity HflC (stomatin/prohibitin superfamily)
MDKPIKNSGFKKLVTASILVVTLGTGFNLEAQQSTARQAARLAAAAAAETHNRCVETAKRARATAPALAKFEAAARADGDIHMADVWHQYLDAAKKNPIPMC